MGWELLFLLLPIAAFTGWLIGRSGSKSGRSEDCTLSAEYFKGLNYLLNEQSDKALEVFIHMFEVDSESVETHFALGNLFLRRGEVERAIRIHQNLIARPTLTLQQRQQALLELGRDYLRAGLLDRAEALFKQVSDSDEIGTQALKLLLELYQLEKEWHGALDTAQRLRGNDRDGELSTLMAHLLCELAEEGGRSGKTAESIKLLRQALAEDPGCVRATLLIARIEMTNGNYRRAIDTLLQVRHQDVAFIPEILTPLYESFQQLDAEEELMELLGTLLDSGYQHSSVVVMLVSLLEQHGREERAMELLRKHLATTPSLEGLSLLVEHKRHHASVVTSDELGRFADLLHRLLEGKGAYRCRQCGYTVRTLLWQCPGCKHWGSVKPLSLSESD